MSENATKVEIQPILAVEGLKVYFETEANKADYLGDELEHPDQDLNVNLDNPQ